MTSPAAAGQWVTGSDMAKPQYSARQHSWASENAAHAPRQAASEANLLGHAVIMQLQYVAHVAPVAPPV